MNETEIATIDCILSDNIVLSRERAISSITNPGDWNTSSPSDWRYYVPKSIIAEWHRLTLEAKTVAYVMAIYEVRHEGQFL